jgi:hypothetical protein
MIDDLVRNGQGDLALMFEYDHRSGEVKIIGYAELNNENGEFTEQGAMNAYMEQAVLHSELPDKGQNAHACSLSTLDTYGYENFHGS